MAENDTKRSPLAEARCEIDHVTAVPTRGGDGIVLTLTVSITLETAAALDIVMRMIGAIHRAQGGGDGT